MNTLTDQFQLRFWFCIGNTKQLYLLLHYRDEHWTGGWLTRRPPRSFTNPIWHSAALCLHWSAIVPLCFHLLLCSLMVWFTACDSFHGASACWLSHMKQ